MPQVVSSSSPQNNNSLQEEEENIAPDKETTKQKKSDAIAISGFVKRASQLRGLVFGNGIDVLLEGGLLPKTLTFLYGENSDRMMNILCGNSIRLFGGRAIFIDAANSFDPYLIVRQCVKEKSASASKELLRSIIISRAFTCYQLHNLLTKEIEKLLLPHSQEEEEIKSIFVSGIGSVFNEQDNTTEEIERLQLLMASALRDIASAKENSVQFVVASSKTRSEHFIVKSNTAIKLLSGGEMAKSSDNGRAILMKHHVRQFAVADL